MLGQRRRPATMMTSSVVPPWPSSDGAGPGLQAFWFLLFFHVLFAELQLLCCVGFYGE